MSRCQFVTSYKLPLLNLTDDIEGNWSANILSVFCGKLLISSDSAYLRQLLIISREGIHYKTLKFKNYNGPLFDATWTPDGNIILAFSSTGIIDKITESGKIIHRQEYTENSMYGLSVSNNIIYLATKLGVLQSLDDGYSWSKVFEAPDGATICRAIKVNANYSEYLWTVEVKEDISRKLIYHARVYSMDKISTSDKLTWKDIDSIAGKHIDFRFSSLSYDGNMKIFLSSFDDKTVHVLSVNEQCSCQILSSVQIKHNPLRLAVDDTRQLLYVGQDNGVVEVYNFICENKMRDTNTCYHNYS